MKKCKTCEIEKEVNFYRKVKGYKDGLNSECKLCEKVRLKLWRKNNPEKYYAQGLRSIAKRRETGWAYNLKYKRDRYIKKGRYIRTPEQKKTEDHLAKIVWKKNNPDQVRAHGSLRRARLRGVTVEKVLPSVVFNRDKGVCGICKKEIEGKYELDHIIPLAKQGEHSYKNMQLAHPTCNRVKHIKTEFTMVADKY